MLWSNNFDPTLVGIMSVEMSTEGERIYISISSNLKIFLMNGSYNAMVCQVRPWLA